ncbi:SgcJ/EcaC family oxidoreductase [Dactylosporangium cerinum]|uniref:SgcJ/EcaC family oxidoreductase n=1 Tax=Dactylosporangium cerinum TaxID=1434730 RepID=A0ABV9WGU3_9ACTN
MPTINDTIDRLNQAWNDRDATAYAATFTPDATYIVFDGTVLRGRAEIEDTHRFLMHGPLRGSRIDGGPAPLVRYLRPDVAHAVIGGGVRLDAQPTVPADRASVISLVLAADPDGAWLIAAFQNTRRDA